MCGFRHATSKWQALCSCCCCKNEVDSWHPFFGSCIKHAIALKCTHFSLQTAIMDSFAEQVDGFSRLFADWSLIGWSLIGWSLIPGSVCDNYGAHCAAKGSGPRCSLQ